ncbi:MAG: hypothetical protein M1816_002231 [Peltula sp. TS41687]|nr:MAG: hypothetical protein M1816_002231 [Peltula sp. TS41687]
MVYSTISRQIRPKKTPTIMSVGQVGAREVLSPVGDDRTLSHLQDAKTTAKRLAEVLSGAASAQMTEIEAARAGLEAAQAEMVEAQAGLQRAEVKIQEAQAKVVEVEMRKKQEFDECIRFVERALDDLRSVSSV